MTNKSSIELYKILIAIYNNPNNHNLDIKSKGINHVVISNGINTIRMDSTILHQGIM